MTIIEFKKKKADLEERIHYMLVQFQIDTGVTVDDISVHTIDVRTVDGPKERQIMSVSVHAPL